MCIRDRYSADGVRVGLMLSSAAGNDLLFDTSLCDQGKSFSNKIWNSFRLVKGWKVVKKNQPTHCSIAIEWYNQKFNSVLSEINDHFNKFRISDALMAVYKLIWDDFCSVFLEIVKPNYSDKDSWAVLPENIPDEIIVDLAGTDIGTSIKISSVKLGNDVVPTITDRDFVIATVASPTVIKEPEKPAEGEAAAEGAEGEAAAEGAEATAETSGKEGEPAKKDDKGKDASPDKKPAEKKPAEKK